MAFFCQKIPNNKKLKGDKRMKRTILVASVLIPITLTGLILQHANAKYQNQELEPINNEDVTIVVPLKKTVESVENSVIKTKSKFDESKMGRGNRTTSSPLKIKENTEEVTNNHLSLSPSMKKHEKIIRYAYKEAEKNGIPPEILLGLIEQENSTFNSKLVSVNQNKTYDYGLMQINSRTAPEIAKELGIKNFSYDMLLNPEINIQFGVKKLKNLLEKYPNEIHHCLTAYNRGENGAKSYFRENKTYISLYSANIYEKKKKYKDLF